MKAKRCKKIFKKHQWSANYLLHQYKFTVGAASITLEVIRDQWRSL